MGSLGTFFDFLLVLLGFGSIIFIHELGHFLAARWAGIRVLAFAIGFGPPVFTWRRGLGLRRGSSEREYVESAARAGSRNASGAISPTEYRLNWLPFGGYVKMLGQDDLDPTAVSSAPDSYQNCKPWKRMVVISAGVVMNLILAAMLFVLVFRVGLRTEPAEIGEVAPGSAASVAVATNASELGVTTPGLRTGDEILEINGRKPNSFNDLMLASAMGTRGEPVNLVVRRAEVARPLTFAVVPIQSPLSKLLELGVEPPHSNRILPVRNESDRAKAAESLAKLGLPGVEPGMTLTRAGTIANPTGAEALTEAARAGAPFEVEFTDGTKHVTATLTPRAELQVDQARTGPDSVALHRHLLGLTPVMKVASVSESGAAGLREGDVFVRLGPLEYPSRTQGIPAIRAQAGKTIDLVLARKQPDGSWRNVPLTVDVSREGTIGFYAGETGDDDTLLAVPPSELESLRNGGTAFTPPARAVVTHPGSRVIRVGDVPVADFSQLRTAQVDSTRGAFARVPLTLAPPGPDGPSSDPAAAQRVELALSPADVRALHALSWISPIDPGLFTLREKLLRADGIGAALTMGLDETRRVMLSTYTTFARLFQGTVKVEHLKGPVGIAHLGTRIADRGLVWLLFFMAMISVNLAVVNFLPLPIADGGQFIFLLIEHFRGRPVPLAVQNIATIAGLILIGGMFLVVTFNDVKGLFSP